MNVKRDLVAECLSVLPSRMRRTGLEEASDMNEADGEKGEGRHRIGVGSGGQVQVFQFSGCRGTRHGGHMENGDQGRSVTARALALREF